MLGVDVFDLFGLWPVVRAIMMATFGILVGCIGQDQETGVSRFVFGVPDLLDGIGLAPFVMGLFGISEVFTKIEKSLKGQCFSGGNQGALPQQAGLEGLRQRRK